MARGKSLNDINSQYYRIRAALIERGQAGDWRNGRLSPRLQAITKARKKYVTNLKNTKSGARDLEESRRDLMSDAIYKFADRKYSRNTYMGLANG